MSSICISLAQPYASLLITGVKQFETRSWRPGPRNLAIIQRDGLLIHASLSKKYAYLQGIAPLWGHLSKMGPLSYGAIIGQCSIGRIMRTEDWLKEFKPEKGSPAYKEWQFGDYDPGRWCWEVLEPVKFDQPIPYKGSLSLWNYPKPIPKRIQELI